MFDGTQLMHWLDAKNRVATRGPISQICGEYFTKVSEIQGSRTIWDFTDSNDIKVTDWKGWTDLISITKASGSSIPSFIIRTKGGKELRATTFDQVPVYDENIIIKGFHGETKYLHRIELVGNLRPGDTLRVLHLDNEDGDSFDFDQIAVIEPVDLVDTGYSIITRSGFMNLGDAYIFSGTKADEERINKWYQDNRPNDLAVQRDRYRLNADTGKIEEYSPHQEASHDTVDIDPRHIQRHSDR